MNWVCFATTGLSSRIKCEAVCPKAKVKLGRIWVMQQKDSDPKCSKSTRVQLKKKRIEVRQLPSQSPDLEMLKWNMKRGEQ